MRARFTAACAATASAVVSLAALGQVTAGPAAAAPTTPTASATPAHVRTEKVCATPTRGHLGCFAIKQVAPVEPAAVTPNALPSGYGPGDLRSAYALTASGSSTQTVAIVDAQDDPNAASDLATYRSTYGLPACTTSNGCFQKVNQSGTTSPLPSADSGWAGEISLDLDMVSAICPNCHILLVEASSATTANLGTAVDTAVRLGARYVSNSYGGPEDSSVTSADSSYYIHPGVVITASAGDADYDGGSYPATGAGVTAVGGTSLVRNSSSRGWGETVWNTTSYSEGTGSGCSQYIAKPAFQNGITTGCSKRAEADVSAVADPATGVAVYQTYGGSGWAVYGGTSAASPIIASVYALAGTPGSSDSPNAYPYAHPGNLNDVTSGSNGTCGAPICTAGVGWDGPTGLGTPNGTAAFTPGGSTGGGGTGGGGTTGTCATGQKIGNPGFESGNTVWSASSGVIGQNGSGGEPARSGTWDAWLDGYGTTTTDTLTQSVSVPAGCTNSTLSFYLHIDTAETGSTPYDKLVVKLGSTTLATYSNVNAGSGYSVHTFKVGSLAGQTVTLSFTGSEDSSNQTSFVLDDTALNAA